MKTTVQRNSQLEARDPGGIAKALTNSTLASNCRQRSWSVPNRTITGRSVRNRRTFPANMS